MHLKKIIIAASDQIDCQRMKSARPFFLICTLFLALGNSLNAQPASLSSSNDLPDAPGIAAAQSANGSSQSTTTNSASSDAHQTKRILGIIPNFRAVSADTQLPPQTVKQKFTTAMDDSFDYSSFIFAGAVAGYNYGENSVPEFRRGAASYGRYYWHVLADQTDENLFVEFIVPSALHEDTRYYTLGHGGFIHRVGYSFGRLLITRTDSGGQSPNFAELVGAGSAAGISNLYYPPADRSWTKTGQRWVLNLGIDGTSFVVREFWPDVNRAIFHQKN